VKVIHAKILSGTKKLPKRVKVWSQDTRLTVYGLEKMPPLEAYKEAVKQFCKQLNWKGKLLSGFYRDAYKKEVMVSVFKNTDVTFSV
jgi:hypothetical protein